MTAKTQELKRCLYDVISNYGTNNQYNDLDAGTIPVQELMNISAELIKLDNYDLSCISHTDDHDLIPRALCEYLEFKDEKRKNRLISVMIKNIIDFYEPCIQDLLNETMDEIENDKE